VKHLHCHSKNAHNRIAYALISIFLIDVKSQTDETLLRYGKSAIAALSTTLMTDDKFVSEEATYKRE
jgi:hypothetical protein